MYGLVGVVPCAFPPMSTNQKLLDGRRTPLSALTVIVWLLFGFTVTAFARHSPNIQSKSHHDSSSLVNTGSSPSLSSSTEGATAVSRRDLLLDDLASSVPIPSIGNNTKPGLLLRSSTHSVNGIGGYPLFALPILSSELGEILSKAQVDLQTRDNDVFVSSYHVNTAKWSFMVLVANTTLHRASIQAVIKRFLKLSLTTVSPQDIVSTRVGVIYDSSTPIADILIMPFQIANGASRIPFFSSGNHSFVTSQPTEIVRVTPFGSNCAYEILNETTALAPYLNHRLPTEQNITARSIETVIIRKIGETAYDMSIRLWQRENGLPVEVKIWVIKAIVFIAYWQIIFGALLEMLDITDPLGFYGGELSSDERQGLDTGFYVVGRLMVRFVAQVTKVVGQTIFSRNIWEQILATLLNPLRGMSPSSDNAWAMEGEIYGPSNSTGPVYHSEDNEESRRRDPVAKWQVWIGDYDDFDL